MSNTDRLSTPSLSSSSSSSASSTTSSRPTSPSLSTTNLQIINNKPIKIKTLDLNSYFSDLDGEEDYNDTDEISKFKSSHSNLTRFNSNSNFIQFDQIETLNRKKKETFGIDSELEKFEKSNFLLSSSSSKTSIKSEGEIEQEEIFSTDDDDEEDDQEDQEWVQTQWNSLIQKQIIREKEIRKLILSRQVLQPLDLKEWLDSDQTCDLPALSLGVLLRMDPLASTSNQITTISKYSNIAKK